MFTIRKATVADCELIHKMAKEVFPATYKEILSPEQLDYMMDWMYAPSNVRKQMEEEGHVYSIAYKENEPCGYVSIQQQEKDVFHLQKIYVLPRFQGTHCGSFLFKEGSNTPDNILVTIQTRDSLNIRKSKLDYRGLKELVEKLEGLCWRFRV